MKMPHLDVLPSSHIINNLSFQDGVVLCRLMKVLRKDDIGRVRVKKRMSQIEASDNLALALRAMKEDGLKLVNIGQFSISYV